jgi:hypothetical protein
LYTKSAEKKRIHGYFKKLTFVGQKLMRQEKWQSEQEKQELGQIRTFSTTQPNWTGAIQAGGVAVITTNDLIPIRSESRGGDPTGLGQWAWTRIEGSDDIHTRLVSVY